MGEDGRTITLVGTGVVDQGVVQFQDRELSSASVDGPVWTIFCRDGEFEAAPRVDG